jgi:tetratricopeptide (TPR) repeat protein
MTACLRFAGARFAAPARRNSPALDETVDRALSALPGGGETDIDEAVGELPRAVEQESGNAQFHLVLGQLLAEQQQYGAAIEHMRRAMTLAADNAEYADNLGLALRLQGDLEAEAQFRAALAKSPDHALARRSLGLVLRQKGDVTYVRRSP